MSKINSRCSWNRETSVEVPPISNPIIGCFECEVFHKAFLVVIEYPTTPPAGPDKIDFDPLKLSIGHNPPSLYMNRISVFFTKSSSNPLMNPCKYQ